MKALCVANDPRELADHQQSRVVESEGLYPLTIGKSYTVLGMTIAERALYLLVRDDNGLPSTAPAGFFEVFTADLPTYWKFRLDAGIHASGRELWVSPRVALWGYPEFVDEPEHVNALFELEPSATAIFDSYVNRLE